jgi:hypothetical protein
MLSRTCPGYGCCSNNNSEPSIYPTVPSPFIPLLITLPSPTLQRIAAVFMATKASQPNSSNPYQERSNTSCMNRHHSNILLKSIGLSSRYVLRTTQTVGSSYVSRPNVLMFHHRGFVCHQSPVLLGVSLSLMQVQTRRTFHKLTRLESQVFSTMNNEISLPK